MSASRILAPELCYVDGEFEHDWAAAIEAGRIAAVGPRATMGADRGRSKPDQATYLGA